MLKDFYTLTKKNQITEEQYECHIFLNKEHSIFEGHFPNNPVTPGVCMLQIIKNITEDITQKKLFLFKTSNVKFMALINPEVNPELVLTLNIKEDDNQIVVKNTTSFDKTIALKLTNTYKIC